MSKPAVSPEQFSTFGNLLKYLRRREELTQRELAIQVGYSDTQISRLEQSQRVPDAATLTALFVPALHIEREAEWVARLLELAKQARNGEILETEATENSQPKNNLPASLTTFIGREKAKFEIIKQLRKYRLVTLTGPGGVGKTRLSIKVGELVLGDYANGVWLVELASLNDPALLPQTVTALFGILGQPNNSPTETLINFLRAKTALLILDNCEHVLEACAQLANALLKNCPNLKILATSRESLGITGEAAYLVPSLGLPDIDPLLENFRKYESVCLFEERAQLAEIDFSLTLENAYFIAKICRRLDGIPLAIELAAARVNMFSIDQIATQLVESFNLLTGGSRTALPRQQTIHASIEWSWNLLTDSERLLLQRLSVFAGGWTLEAAQSVCSDAGIESHQIVELMTQLVKKSLVMVNQVAGSETRYYFHEIVRQYAHEELVEAGEVETIRAQHLKYFLKFSELAEPALRGPQQMEWLERANDERDNIRAALEMADKTNVEAGLFLSGRLQRFWESFDLHEGEAWLAKFIQKPESMEYPQARAKALLAHGWRLFDFEKFDLAHSAAQECLEIYSVSNDKTGELDALNLLGAISQVQGTPDMELFQQALSLSQSMKDTWREARVLSRLGGTGDYQRRIAYLEKAITLFRELGDLRSLAGHLGLIGNLELLRGNFDAAQKMLREAVQLNQKLHNKATGTGHLLSALARIEAMQGNFEKGRAFLEESLSIANELGNRMFYLWSRAYLGYLTLHEGKASQAHEILTETTQEFYKDQSEIGVAFTLEGLAGWCVTVNQLEEAARFIGWADATREKVSDPRPLLEQADVDKIIATCLTKIGEVAFANAYEEGQKMTLNEAVALALEE